MGMFTNKQKRELIEENGRLANPCNMWTLKEIQEVAKHYTSREQIYRDNQNLYHAIYSRGLWDELKLKKERKRVMRSNLGFDSVVIAALLSDTYKDFTIEYSGAASALRRYGINPKEFYENRHNKSYIKELREDIAIKDFSV
jgi:hypothetical protein